jgi:NADPH oxidase
VHVRQAGDFTKALGERLGCTAALADELTQQARYGQEKIISRDTAYGLMEFQEVTSMVASLPALRVDGPYGAPAEDVFESEVAVLIGTGIGVTPWASVLKHIR